MSSMTKNATWILLATAALIVPSQAHAQKKPKVTVTYAPTPAPPRAAAPAPVARPLIAASTFNWNAVPVSATADGWIANWRALRRGGDYSFSTYAGFLNAAPGFPGESTMRRTAEKAMRPGENAALVNAFFRDNKPVSGNGWARLADAQAASGRTDLAVRSAREAWASADLPANDEVQLLARFGNQFTRADHDRRLDALLFAKRASDAARLAYLASPGRQAAFAARIALQRGDSGAEGAYAAAAGGVTSDAGLMMDRARYLRDRRDENSARALFARSHQFAISPADAERFTEMMLILARGASADGRHQQAFDIARQTRDLLAPGQDPRDQSYGVRDNLTSLAWLAGTTAMGPLGRPGDAVASFYTYANAGRSQQVEAKGYYWASQAAARAGRAAEARTYLEKTAANPDQFYGQLAHERLGRALPAPAALPVLMVSDSERAAFARSPVVQAYRRILRVGSRSEQALFVRSLSESLDSDKERIMASELGAASGRIDLPVWVARSARNAGSGFYYRPAFPTLSYAPRGGRTWSLTHGIARQESSFDPSVVSHANAHGMMQVLPSTGAEQAGKMGVAFNASRLTTDPAFNVMLGSAYFQRLLDRWGGSYPLAVASYNAGAGNVNKWVRNYGDPRTSRVDMLNWIEKIPFEETRGYVQRVLENSVVYDTMDSSAPAAQRQLTYYLNRGSFSG